MKNIKINRFGVYFLPRIELEDDAPNKIKIIEKKIETTADNKYKTALQSDLKLLRSYRPCVVLKVYRGNVTVIPVTSSIADESQMKIEPISAKYTNSYLKISVIKTFDKKRFIKIMQRAKNKKISKEDIDSLMKVGSDFYFR